VVASQQLQHWNMRLPPEALALMQAQHGLITRRQLTSMGCTEDSVDGMVRRDQLDAVFRGVYCWPGSAAPPEQRVLAAVLRCGQGARAGGLTACALHRLEGFQLDGPLQIVVPSERWVRGVPFTVRYGPPILPADRATVAGIPTVSVTRALIDVGDEVLPKRLRVAVDSACRNGLLTVDWLDRQVRAHGRSPGALAMRRLLDSGALGQESEGERVMASVFAGSELQLEWGCWLLPGVRVDAVDRPALLVLEYDGRRHHTLESDQHADGWRQRLLEAAGYRVERITWVMIHDHSASLVARMERIRRERLALFQPNRRG
jgi:hypothetical protein